MRIIWMVLILLPLTLQAAVFRAVDAPPATVVRSSIASASQAVQKIYFSERVEVSPALRERVLTGVDLVQLEVDKIEKLIAAPGPATQKHITYVRYTSGDMRLANVLIKAKRLGIGVDILIDLNPVLAGEVDDPNELSNEFERLAPRAEDSPGYQAYRAFLAGGFRMGVDLFSQPIYNAHENERTPIFHEKALALSNGPEPTTLLISSANSAPNPRVNRTLEIRDEDLFRYYLSHVEDLKVLFSSREPKPIRDVAVRAPLQIEYADGSVMRLSFTDGKYNPNDNIVNVLRNQHLKSVLMSQFAFTYGKMADALSENIQMISPEASVTMLLDDKFADLLTWGVGLSLKGAMTASPPLDNGDSRLLFPKPAEVADKIKMYIYQRPAVDPVSGEERIETDEEGPPIARHVNHEKTTVLVDTGGRVYISFGSYNASGNFHNADLQLDIQVEEGSWIYQGFDETIRGLIAKEKDIYVIDVVEATMRNALGMMTGHTDLQVSVQQARDFTKAFWDQDQRLMRDIFAELLAQPTTLENVASLTKRRAWTKRFLKFAAGYMPRLYPRHHTPNQLMKILSIVPVITDRPLSEYAQRALIDSIYFGVVNDGERETLVTEDLESFGKSIPAPEKKRASKAVTAQAFDWDNTVLVMPTQIRLFHSSENLTRDISTEEFAAIRMQLGKRGTPYVDWVFKYPESFVQFLAVENWREGFFIPHLEQALVDPHGRAGAFEAFVEGLSSAKSAKSVYIVTARGADVQELIMGLVRLRQIVEKELYELLGKKVTLSLPPRANFHPLAWAGAEISAAKARVLADVIPRELKYKTKAFYFYEDDPHTREVVAEFLKANLNREQLGKVKIIDPKDAPRPITLRREKSCEKSLRKDPTDEPGDE